MWWKQFSVVTLESFSIELWPAHVTCEPCIADAAAMATTMSLMISSNNLAGKQSKDKQSEDNHVKHSMALQTIKGTLNPCLVKQTTKLRSPQSWAAAAARLCLTACYVGRN
ncbi:hypothetical protein COO60DRAFT_224947 [Scenedesmus sp. NREL 46B-D3]|nr:hypothetical protein COO60DRAFT_224947 [Scenedesmus sp. NREL 46B-D3]